MQDNRRGIATVLLCVVLLGFLWIAVSPRGHRVVFAEPQGTLTVYGRWMFHDRNNDVVPANNFLVQLLNGNNSHLAWGYTGADGRFSLGPVNNPGSVGVRVRIWMYDAYESGTLMVMPQGGAGWADTYSWDTGVYVVSPYMPEYSVGTHTVAAPTAAHPQPKACWLLDDLRRGFSFPPDPPGSFTIEWPHPGGNQRRGSDGHILLTRDSSDSPDSLLHEMGHGVMANFYDAWPPANCPSPHFINRASNPVCAWTEGWATFWAFAVNDDPFYDWPGGGSTDFESPTWGNPGHWDEGDDVEGRVAGALWDIVDPADDGFDTYDGDFEDIWEVFVDQDDDTLAQFWSAWRTRWFPTGRTHHGVRCLYQSTIDYDHAPVISGLPDIVLDMNGTRNNAIDLRLYASDDESADWYLTYAVVYHSPPDCGVSIDAFDYVDVDPTPNWAGVCAVVVEASDTLRTDLDWFTVTVVDDVPPNPPGNVRLTSPQANGWAAPSVTVAWDGAVDVGSGVDGYSFAWDTCWPDRVEDVEDAVTSAAGLLSTTGTHYFSVRAVDGWGNWGNPTCVQFRVDATPPSSSVAHLPPAQVHDWWSVDWSGSDAHVGVSHYDVQYKEGSGGVWTNWLMATQDTRGLFIHATPGQMYYFRCRAVDRVGNVEAWPASADTWTQAGFDTTGLFEMYLPVVTRDR